jgi:hypothetical protein
LLTSVIGLRSAQRFEFFKWPMCSERLLYTMWSLYRVNDGAC